MEQRVVYQELKSLYAVSFTSIAETDETNSPPTHPLPPPICPYIIKFYGRLIPNQSFFLLIHHSIVSNLILHFVSTISPVFLVKIGAFVDIDYGAVCLTLDFMNAGSLQNLLDEGKILDLDEACVLCYCALRALSTLHKRSILHRDVKPSNFLVNTEGAIKLSDFGITKVSFFLT